jgi:hypothetical protein
VPVFTGARRPANGTASALGMEVLPLDPQLRKELHVPKEVNGVVVGKVASDSPHQSKCSDDPLPTERVEGLANILRIVAGDLTMEEIKGATE